jgi:endonuclease YncB( thermonuclease family)
MRTPGLKYRTTGKDRYDRVLVWMEMPRGDVGETMIAGGYARAYQGGYCRRDSPKNTGEAGGKEAICPRSLVCRQ